MSDSASREGDAATTAPPRGRRLLLWGGGLALVVLLSVGSTVLLFSALQTKPQPSPVNARTVATNYAAASELERLQGQIDQQAREMALMREKIQALDDAVADGDLGAALADQERRYQQFLSTMKEGMVDLANMVRGSRTWLEQYGAQLDQAFENSKAREQALRGEPGSGGEQSQKQN